MSTKKEPAPQRNAFAPGLIAAAALFVGPALVDGEAFTVIQYIVAILAAIVAVFALQARQWWWTIVFAAVLVLWNPIVPFDLPAPAWAGLHIAAAVAFIAAGILIATRPETRR